MVNSSVRSRVAGFLGLGIFIAMAGALVWAAGVPGVPAMDDVNSAVAGSAVLAAWACLIWIALGVVATVLGALPGVLGRAARRLSVRIAPPLVRKLVSAALGVAVATGPLIAPAAAEPPDTAMHVSVMASLPSLDRPGASRAPVIAPTSAEHTPADAAPEPPPAATPSPTPEATRTPPAEVPAPTPTATRTPVPTAVAATASAASAASAARPPGRPPVTTERSPAPPPRAEDSSATYVVQRGDSLWAIAARHLPPGASAAEIARTWPEWYAANRDVIGDDPNLILPGQILAIPSSAAAVAQ